MIIVRTPLRLSFVGGGSDIKAFYDRVDGAVVSSAIDKYVYVVVKERFDDMIYLNYTRKERVERVGDIEHDLIREAMKMAGVEKGVEVTTLADIPSEGSGLGSSSAITVALLHVFYAYQGELVTAEQLAREACQIEIDIVGKPIGRQDQYAAAYGSLHEFRFCENDEVKRSKLPVSNGDYRRLSSSILLFYTGIVRSADTILSEQKRNFSEEEKFETMSEMVSLVEPFKRAVEQCDIEKCGQLLDRNWELKQRMASGITNPQITEMYERAKAAGALGGKIAGAGGGGFLMLIVPREKQNTVFEAMKEYREMPFMLERSGSKVIFDDRRYSSK